MERELMWELDRQVVLNQLQNVILVLRSNSRFASKSRFLSTSQNPAEHPLLQDAIGLHNHILSSSGPISSFTPSTSGSGGSHIGGRARAASTAAAAPGDVDGLDRSLASISSNTATDDRDVVRSLRSSLQRVLTEEDLLTPFAAVCRSEDTSETVTSVAISGFVAILERPCSFVTVRGVRIALEAAALARSSSAQSPSHEVLMARIVQLYVAAIRHPAATELPEETYVRIVGRTLVLALRPETSPLLKRTAENALNTMVATLYTRVVVATCGVPSSLVPHGRPGSVAGSALEGTSMMCYISSLITGEVTALNSEGSTILKAADDSGKDGGGTGSSLDGNLTKGSGGARSGSSGGSGGAGGGKLAVAVVCESGPAIQLEGLWLAQAALFALRHHLNDDKALRLRAAVQNDLSRALLIAGVGTSHVVVLSQILRTIHIAVKCASEHLVPQMLSFLRVLHLKPLAALTEELNYAESSPTSGGGGGGGFFGSGSSNSTNGGNRYGSPQPAGASSPPGPGSPTSSGGGGYVSSSRLVELYEQKEVLLESLAEFCSDPGFLSFCYAHYDLSWCYTPVLPQLCDVLVSNVYVDGGGDGLEVVDGRPGEGVSGRAGSESAVAAGGGGASRRRRSLRPVNRLQLVALDAATNMVSELTLRVMSASSFSHGSAASVTPTDSGPSLSPHPAASQSSAASACLTRASAQQAVNRMIAQKKLLMQFTALFEDSPQKKAIPFLLEHALRADTAEAEAAAARNGRTWLVVRNPAGGREIGQALFRLSTLLGKRALGDHIGDLGRERTQKPSATEMVTVRADGTVVAAPSAEGLGVDDESVLAVDAASAGSTAEAEATTTTAKVVPALELWENSRVGDHLIVGTVRFYEEQLKGFIEMFEFRGKPLLAAIREMVYRLCLPGESQKIDRIMETFARHWYTQNEGEKAVNPFHSDSGAFVLSFAIIMLNTVCHSKRLDRTMTLADFKGMNRGIDDGNNVPDEYLAAIYSDVEKHEVIMAEMMNRGFSNNITWDLEMNGVQQHGFHGVDGTLATMLLLCASAEDEEEEAAEDDINVENAESQRQQQQQVSGVFGATIAEPMKGSGRDEALAAVLDPYVFDAVWKRCLLVFDSMAASAAAQVSRLNPRGVSIKDAVDHAKALMPTEVSALVSSLRGVHMLARAAHTLHVPSAADQCMLTLLPHVALELSSAQDVVDGIYRSLPKLLFAREVFALLRTTAASLVDSWPLLADFVMKLYLLGFFTVPAASATSSNTSTTTTTTAVRGQEAAPPLPEVLSCNPGIVDSDPEARQTRAADGDGGSGGGWFASFFGAGGNGRNSSSNKMDSSADQKMGTSNETATAITATPRVRECIPDMEQLLRALAHIPTDARQRFIKALVAQRRDDEPQHQQKAGTSQTLRAQQAFILSYKVCFTTAVMLAPAPTTTAPTSALSAAKVGGKDVPGHQEEVDSDGNNNGEDSGVTAVFLPHLSNTVHRILELSAKQTPRRRSGTAESSTAAYWQAMSARVVSGVLGVAQYELLTQYRRAAATFLHHPHTVMIKGGSATDRGAVVIAPVPLLEAVWRLLQVFLELPTQAFNTLAALPIARLLEEWTACLVNWPEAPLPFTALELRMLVPLASHVAGLLTKSADSTAVAVLCRTCHTLAKHQLYDVGQQTNLLAGAALALAVVRDQQENGTTSSSLNSTPFSSATSRNAFPPPQQQTSTTQAARTGSSQSQHQQQRHVAPGEIVGTCCRNVLRAVRELSQTDTTEGNSKDVSAWLQLWIFCLGRLAGMAVRAGSPRAGSEALLSLQRSLQDTELDSVPASVIQAVYNEVLFPLVEHVCAPGSEVSFANVTPPPPAARQAMLPPEQSAGAAAGDSASGFLSSLFGASSGALPATIITPNNTNSASCLMPIVPVEVKCRVVNLLPKVLLQYTSSLAEYPELLQDLWQRVLGTLYAMYTAYPTGAGRKSRGRSPSQRREELQHNKGKGNDDEAPAEGEGGSDNKAGATQEEGEEEEEDEEEGEETMLSDEAVVMREAVEETVKNMVYVVAAMSTDEGSIFQRVPYFATATRNLVRPFSFAGPLLAFMDSVDGSQENSPTK